MLLSFTLCWSLVHMEGCATWPPRAEVSLVSPRDWLAVQRDCQSSNVGLNWVHMWAAVGTGIKASSLGGSADTQDVPQPNTWMELLQLICCKSTLVTLGAWPYWQGNQSWDLITLHMCWQVLCLTGSDLKDRNVGALTRRSDMGVLSLAGRCCSRAKTMQLAIIVARIMYSNGVWGLRNSWKWSCIHFTAISSTTVCFLMEFQSG